jgi:hypothetical protein
MRLSRLDACVSLVGRFPQRRAPHADGGAEGALLWLLHEVVFIVPLEPRGAHAARFAAREAFAKE